MRERERVVVGAGAGHPWWRWPGGDGRHIKMWRRQTLPCASHRARSRAGALHGLCSTCEWHVKRVARSRMIWM